MLWSRYNHVFRSERHGVLLYNAVTNTFMEVPEPFGEMFLKLRRGDEVQLDEPGMLLQLMAAKVIVDPGEDERLRNTLLMKRRLMNLSDEILLLTIAPTRKCNFKCTYCFEADRRAIDMSREVEENLIAFVRGFRNTQILGVTWFGGEPLLKFETIKRLSEGFLKLGFRRYTASIITNGYLLDQKKIDCLQDLAIHDIQITLDGPEEIHDRRRMLLGGGGTFQKILSNLDLLFASSWPGKVAVRINVDPSNEEGYHQLYEMLTERYAAAAGKRLNIYPGIVQTFGMQNPDTSCLFDIGGSADFQIRQFRRHGVKNDAFYPQHALFQCTAGRKNGYMIGPEGEVYKCWNDLGEKDRVLGNINSTARWNSAALSDWMEAWNPLNDPECLECSLFPVCDGGCPSSRRTKTPHCTRFRERLAELLEAHYDETH